jgi:hypothetical protein
VTINCPGGCVYLQSARRHPPSAERRQAAADAAVLAPMVQGLTAAQSGLLSLVVAITASHQPDALAGLDDRDVIEAIDVVAATFETASRGVIYEHRAERPGARRLAADLRTAIARLDARGARVAAGDAAVVLRRVAEAARQATSSDDGSRAFVGLLRRVNRVFQDEAGVQADAPAPAILSDPVPPAGGLIMPGRR